MRETGAVNSPFLVRFANKYCLQNVSRIINIAYEFKNYQEFDSSGR